MGAQAVLRGGRPQRFERAEGREVRALQPLDAGNRLEEVNLPGFYGHTLQAEAPG
jgi:hypothetical protein